MSTDGDALARRRALRGAAGSARALAAMWLKRVNGALLVAMMAVMVALVFGNVVARVVCKPRKPRDGLRDCVDVPRGLTAHAFE